MADPKIVHWACQYIGLPWELGASGPDAYDCYQFVRFIQRKHFNVELPEVEGYSDWRVSATEIEHNPERLRWVQVTMPREGDVTLMARSLIPVHIGIFVKANQATGVLHCLQQSGVVYNTLHSLGPSGWGGVRHYRKMATK